MRFVVHEDLLEQRPCHGLHIRWIGFVRLLGPHPGARLFKYSLKWLLFKRFTRTGGWAFCGFGWHIFWAKRLPGRHGIMIHGSPPERRRPLHVRRVH